MKEEPAAEDQRKANFKDQSAEERKARMEACERKREYGFIDYWDAKAKKKQIVSVYWHSQCGMMGNLFRKRLRTPHYANAHAVTHVGLISASIANARFLFVRGLRMRL